MPATLERPRAQHWEALDRANHIRLHRATVKRRVEAGESVEQHILEPDEELQNMPIGELIRAQHRWGSIRVRKFLSSMGLSEKRPLGKMTERQRLMVAEAVGRRNEATRALRERKAGR